VAPHYIENTGDVDLVFLEIFAAPELLDISLKKWMRRLPKLMVREHLSFRRKRSILFHARKNSYFGKPYSRLHVRCFARLQLAR
jgi:oxalate decarboxylase/phosphoglucose isomerase-like protein (cupin superfamily)